MMSMDGSGGDEESIYSTATDISAASSAFLINGMDSSVASRIGKTTTAGRRSQSRDSTSTDFAAERKRRPPAKTKTWDGRLDDVLNRRRSTNKPS